MNGPSGQYKYVLLALYDIPRYPSAPPPLEARLAVRGLRVQYGAPGVSMLSFDWDGPLTLDGQDIPLSGYPRWDNPYTRVDFGLQQVHIEFEGERLDLDFQQGTREIR